MFTAQVIGSDGKKAEKGFICLKYRTRFDFRCPLHHRGIRTAVCVLGCRAGIPCRHPQKKAAPPCQPHSLCWGSRQPRKGVTASAALEQLSVCGSGQACPVWGQRKEGELGSPQCARPGKVRVQDVHPEECSGRHLDPSSVSAGP